MTNQIALFNGASAVGLWPPEPMESPDLVDFGSETAPIVTVADFLATYDADPNMSPVQMFDTAANISGGIDELQVLAARGRNRETTFEIGNPRER